MRPYNPGESLQNIIKTAIPDFVEAEFPVFLEFVAAYCRYLETARTTTSVKIFPQYGGAANGNTVIQQTDTYGGSAYEARKLLEYRDVETTVDEYAIEFRDMFAKNFPRYSYIPLNLLARSLRQFYQSKGTTESIQWFFRTFLDQDADVYFPREDILKASDATWTAPKTLKVSSPIADPLTAIVPPNTDVNKFYVGQRIQTDTGSAQIELVTTTVVGQAYNQHIIVNELTLKFDTILGHFEPGQILHNIDTEEAVYTKILPVINGVQVTNGGSNYAIGDVVNFSEGPTGGGGYGAYGTVAAIASTALNGVDILDGGDGYTTGLPVTFTSTTGHGALATVSEIVYGEFLLEDGSGYIITEDSTLESNILTLEDRNTLILELLIEPFVNAIATVTLDNANYGAATGVTQLNNVNLDSAIEIALAAADEKPFMHPWVFTNTQHTNAALANAAVTVSLNSSNGQFTNTSGVFVIGGALDTVTNINTASITGQVIVANTGVIDDTQILYLSNTVNLNNMNVATYMKQNNPVLQLGSVTTNGSNILVGANTMFTTLTPNTHLLLPDGTQQVVRAITNGTFLELYANTSGTSNGSYSVYPTGFITDIVAQSQRFYGKIKTIMMLNNGVGYQTPPLVTAESVSAKAQELFYFDGTSIHLSNGQINPFAHAVLEALQDSGQVTKVTVLSSGVNYTDANNIVITIIHGDGRTGKEAEGMAILGAQTQYPGYFTTSRGFLSSDKYLQDSTFYNDYTYVVKTGESFDRYRNLLLKLMHPAGFKALGYVVDVQTTVVSEATGDDDLTLSSIIEAQNQPSSGLFELDMQVPSFAPFVTANT